LAGLVDASDCQSEDDDALAPDEERFVEVFVDYWISRGSRLMSRDVARAGGSGTSPR
jgi:hypothetical protein